MNDWFDRGFFLIFWVGGMWIVDALTINQKEISFASLMIAAVFLTIIGLIHRSISILKKENTNE